jgi:hypothetical protein
MSLFTFLFLGELGTCPHVTTLQVVQQNKYKNSYNKGHNHSNHKGKPRKDSPPHPRAYIYTL